MSTEKSNNSWSKRIKVRKSGKLEVRKKRQNHYNAKEKAQKNIQKRQVTEFSVRNKTRARFMPHN